MLTITGGICNDNQLALADREVIPDEFDDNGVLIISPTRKLIREINVKFMIQKRNELLEEQNSSHGHQSAVGKSPGEHSNATATNPNIEPHANSSTGTNNTINNNANNTGTGNASTIKGPEASKSNEEVSSPEPIYTNPYAVLSERDLEEIVDQIFLEIEQQGKSHSSDKVGILLPDYMRVIAPTDFISKLRIPI